MAVLLFFKGSGEGIRVNRPDIARWLLLGLSFYQGIRWMFEDASPAFASSPSSSAWGVMLAGAGLFLFTPLSSLDAGVRSRKAALWCAAAIAVWVSAPVLVDTAVGYRAGQNARTLSMALVPVGAAFLAHVREQSADSDLFSRLWPALAGLLGLLLILPEPEPGSLKAWAGLVLSPVITGVAAALVAGPPSDVIPGSAHKQNGRWCISVGLLVGGLLLGVGAWPAAARLLDLKPGATLLQAISISLSLLLLLRLGAARWSSVFLLAPLIAMLGSILLMRPHLDTRSILGLLLLATGGTYTLFRAELSGAAPLDIHRHVS